MTKAEALDSHFSEFRRGDGGDPETFSALGPVTSINGISVTKDTIDATHLGSPGKWDEAISSIKRTGEFDVQMNLLPGSNAITDLIEDLNSDTPRNYQFASPPGEGRIEWTFLAYCTSFEIGASVGDKLTAIAKFKPTGQPGMIA